MGQGDFMIVKRTLAMVILLGTILAVITGCSLIRPPPTASLEITEWTQSYLFGVYSTYVYVYFKVTNTGTVYIDWCQLWIEVTCADGSKYQEDTLSHDVPVGSYITDHTLINVSGKQAVSVSVTNYELTSY